MMPGAHGLFNSQESIGQDCFFREVLNEYFPAGTSICTYLGSHQKNTGTRLGRMEKESGSGTVGVRPGAQSAQFHLFRRSKEAPSGVTIPPYLAPPAPSLYVVDGGQFDMRFTRPYAFQLADSTVNALNGEQRKRTCMSSLIPMIR